MVKSCKKLILFFSLSGPLSGECAITGASLALAKYCAQDESIAGELPTGIPRRSRATSADTTKIKELELQARLGLLSEIKLILFFI